MSMLHGKKQIEEMALLKKSLPAILAFLLIMIVWQIFITFFKVPDYLLPSPMKIFNKIFTMRAILLKNTAITMLEAGFGFLLGSSIGILLAIVFAHSKALERSFYPYAVALKTIPIVAIAPLLVIWFGNGIFSKIVMSALICFFPAIVNTIRGLKAADPEAMDLFDSLNATKWQIFFKLRLPSSLPYIFSALKISTTLSVIGAIVGELSSSNIGIGYIILVSSYRLQTDILFAAITTSAIGGILFFGLIGLIEKKVLYWFQGEFIE